VELIMTLEEKFSASGTKFEIPDEHAERIGRVEQAVWYAWNVLPNSVLVGDPPEEAPLATDEDIKRRNEAKASASAAKTA